MPEGGCFCGNVRYSFTSEPAFRALCHCNDCHKISGSTYSVNFGIPDSNFTLVSGAPKTISKTADSGNKVTNFFCGDCGSTMWRETESFGRLKILKAGTLDDATKLISAQLPQKDLFVTERIAWVPKIEGAEQATTM